MNELLFDETTHTYTLGGFVLPSVTQILKDVGLSNYDFINPEILEAASKFGVAAHYACELEDRNELDLDSLDPALKPYLGAWVKFKEDTGFICQQIEARVYSEKYRYAGTLDRVGFLYERKSIVDIKTGTALPDWIALQTMGYQIAYNEKIKAKDKVKDRYAIQLLPNGDYKLKQYEDKSDLSVFLAALTLRNWKNK